MDSTLQVDFTLWLVLVVLFSAYTRNAQTTTIELGRKLVDSQSGSGVQDAITPRWQTRNNVLMFVGVGVYLIVCFYVFVWYLGLLVFLVTYLLGIPVASKLLVPQPMSNHFLGRIKKDLMIRLGESEAAGDQLRAEAIQDLLKRIP